MNARPTLQPLPSFRTGFAGSKTILVVDDHADISDVLAWHLANQGYHVLTANGPQEAQQLVRSYGASNFSLLLTDVEMPGMRGDELADWFAMENSKAQVIFMSGRPESLPRRHRVTFIEKPFPLATLSALVRKALGKESNFDEQEDAVATRASIQAA